MQHLATAGYAERYSLLANFRICSSWTCAIAETRAERKYNMSASEPTHKDNQEDTGDQEAIVNSHATGAQEATGGQQTTGGQQADPKQQDLATTQKLAEEGELTKPQWRLWHTLVVLLLTLLIFVVGIIPSGLGVEGCRDDGGSSSACHNVVTWVAIMAIMVGAIGVIGRGAGGRWASILIDGRNQMSLSRMQLTLWTILILSTIIVMAMFQIRWGIYPSLKVQATSLPAVSNALNITVPNAVWALLGISTGSLVGAGLIKSQKKENKLGSQGESVLKSEAMKLSGTTETVSEQTTPTPNGDKTTPKYTNQGTLFAYTDPRYASFSDMFTGDEVGSAARVDIAKVQMFFFTVLIVLAYGVTVFSLFISASYPEKGLADVSTILVSLPPLQAGMVTFLAISHAGYLTSKAIPPTSTENTGAG
jgi:hypothetical protein